MTASGTRRYVTVVVHTDGALKSQTFRLPAWLLRAGLIAAAAIGILLLLGLATYLPVASQAARVPGLVREVDRLEQENSRIVELVAALDSAERRYERIRGMLGADIVPDPLTIGSILPVAPPIRARTGQPTLPLEDVPSPPPHWPLDEAGYVTRGQAASGGGGNTQGEGHPGLDIAIPIGSPVRASGGGTVLEAGTHAEYGNYVLVQHPETYQSLYGHLSRLTVRPGTPVKAGDVLGLSGNSGRSSAPHLHFEIRRSGRPVDPREILKEQS
jgi:murein DD-endopeptidase MepM/ murein hydrolase activator NlpD